MKKKLLISQVKVASLQGRSTIPTRIQYDGKSYKIGHEVCARTSGSGGIFDDFKVELGRQSREQLKTRKRLVARGHSRTVMGTAKDFLEALCSEVAQDIGKYGQELPKKVLVAEPISMEEEGKVSGQWLSNYRYAVKSALSGKFEEIDFLPEPFAVFQYYRYGLRHPLISEQTRHIALVLDFGGGTFDVSVIETTKGGDISQSGKTSRPLAAKSIPVGGFFINRKIAESILFSALPDKNAKKKARTLLKSIGNTPLSAVDPGEFSAEDANFIQHFRRLLDDVEAAKVNICSAIRNWDLTENVSHPVRQIIEVPRSPFTKDGDVVGIPLSAGAIREVFVNEIWNARLREAITKAVRRAHEELQGRPISVVLLSGGSTNIGWTKTLIERDLSALLNDAAILEISENYQEVVAKGLAVECARQFYTEGDGDFGAVTYNRLNLVLRSDDKTPRVYSYRPRSPGLPLPDGDGILLPSAASLRAFQGERISWKVKLTSAPSRELGYYYLKSSFDPDDTENLHNVTANRVFIKNRIFGQAIDVELKVDADGSAYPSFLINRGKGEREDRIYGDPFYLDMTYAGEPVAQNSYLGLDFGTATSAASVIFEGDIKAYRDRSADKSWLDLSDLIERLPYPVSHPLAIYVSQTERTQLEGAWKTCIEAMLTFVAYTSFSDVCASVQKRPFDFQPNFNRSAGPLLDLIRRLSKLDLSETKYARHLVKILESDGSSDLDSVIEAINDIKHDRLPRVDFNLTLAHIGNVILRGLGDSQLGGFEVMQRDPFGQGYIGIFRSYTGANPPFIDLKNFSGETDFSSVDVFLVDIGSGSALSLSPLYYTFSHLDMDLMGDCPLHFLDSIKGSFEDYRYIPVKKGEGINVAGHQKLNRVSQIAQDHLCGSKVTKYTIGGAFTEWGR